MKKILLVIAAIFMINALADDVQINSETADSAQEIQGIAIPTEQAQAPDASNTEKINTAEIFDLFNQAQNVIQNTVETIDDASETVGDVAEYINDMCDDYLDENSNVNNSVQISEQKEKLQELFESVVVGLEQQGLSDDQITEILDAINTMKKHGFTAQQIELFIKGLISGAANPSVVEPEITNYWKKVLLHPASTGTIFLIVGILVTTFCFKKFAISTTTPATNP